MPECSGGVTAGGLFTISSPTPALTSHQTLPARPTGKPTKGQLGRDGGGGGRHGGGATSRHRPGLPVKAIRTAAGSSTGSPAPRRWQRTFGGRRGRAPGPHGGRHGCGARGAERQHRAIPAPGPSNRRPRHRARERTGGPRRDGPCGGDRARSPRCRRDAGSAVGWDKRCDGGAVRSSRRGCGPAASLAVL